MCENRTEIYVVYNNVSMYEQRVEYVGTSKEKAQEVCDDHQDKRHPCFIQVWDDGEQQYVTRLLDG